MGLELRCCEGLGFRVRGVWGLGSRGVAGGGRRPATTLNPMMNLREASKLRDPGTCRVRVAENPKL